MAWFVAHTQRSSWHSRCKRRACTQEQGTIRANETVAWLCLETKRNLLFLYFPQKAAQPSRSPSSVSTRSHQAGALVPLGKSSVLHGDKEDNVPRLGLTVRNRPHLISQPQLCTHSATCTGDTGWFAGRLRWEFSLPHRRREIIMSKGQDLHISSIFIKCGMVFQPSAITLLICHLCRESRSGSFEWKKKYYLSIAWAGFLWFID